MVFSSNLFLYAFFLPAFAIHYVLVRLSRTTSVVPNVFLAAISLGLYLWGNGSAILALIATVIGTYWLSRKMEASASPATRKRLLQIGIAGNLTALLYYKYSGFIASLFLPADRVATMLQHLPGAGSLPVGISFYTFMAISYLVEVSDGVVKPSGLIDFGAYLVMFPHLVAGPIVRYSEIVSSVRFRRITLDMLFDGIWLVAIGLGKKVLLANPLGETADAIFSLPASQLSTLLSWGGALSYTFQIYFDFSGYTDIAIGLAMLFGFCFPKNFNSPYTATSVMDFWRRWHMTLTRWFRDYIWFPLGANRHGSFRTLVNLFLVFLLCGLWHGAAWTFVVWGAYHAILLAVERMAEVRFHCQPSGFLGWIYMFVFVLIGWVIFRSISLPAAFSYLRAMFGAFSGEPPLPLSYYFKTSSLFYLGLAALVTFLPLRKILEGLNGPQAVLVRGTASVALLATTVLYLSESTYNPFIYFRF